LSYLYSTYRERATVQSYAFRRDERSVQFHPVEVRYVHHA
jgi:hypothetical protein